MNLTVIIRYIMRLKKSNNQQNFRSNVQYKEIIVVDDFSKDGTKVEKLY